MHPRNRHKGHYDFEQLIRACPELAPFVSPTLRDELSIDFSNPEAVKTLNRALLMHFYGLTQWDIPDGYLCPPVPGRSDYIHSVANLIERDGAACVLDIGVGANCIYPIIGHCEYGWRFVGTDIDPVALASAKRIVDANPKLSGAIELRLQKSSASIFSGVVLPDDRFDLSICNPPFHATAEQAQKSNLRKRNNLGLKSGPLKNFGGKNTELWYPGGEMAFVRQMIKESIEFTQNIEWFTTLISKESNLSEVYAALEDVRVFDLKTIDMTQGHKKSRIIAWKF